jgi:RNA polymerase sigma factor (sigma-70 family)
MTAEARERAEIEALVAWAIRSALARARVKGLPEQDMVSAALFAVVSALGTFKDAKGKLGPHVRRRVRFELIDAAKIANTRHENEVFLDDLEGAFQPGMDDDDAGLARGAGIDALVFCSPEESLLIKESHTAFHREVARLPRDLRQLYQVRYREGLGWRQVAARLGIPEHTARYQDGKLRALLTDALIPRGGFG